MVQEDSRRKHQEFCTGIHREGPLFSISLKGWIYEIMLSIVNLNDPYSNFVLEISKSTIENLEKPIRMYRFSLSTSKCSTCPDSWVYMEIEVWEKTSDGEYERTLNFNAVDFGFKNLSIYTHVKKILDIARDKRRCNSITGFYVDMLGDDIVDAIRRDAIALTTSLTTETEKREKKITMK